MKNLKRKFLWLLLAAVFSLSVLGGCVDKKPTDDDPNGGPETPAEFLGMREIIDARAANIGSGITFDGEGKPMFGTTAGNFAVWGTEVDQWSTALNESKTSMNQYIQAHQYINANAIAIIVPWRKIEKTEGAFDFTFTKWCVEKAAAEGLKVVLYWHSVNYAAGAIEFIPDWVRADTARFERAKLLINNAPITPGLPIYGYEPNGYAADGYVYGTFEGKSGVNMSPLCVRDRDTIDAESRAITALFNFIKANNADGNIVGVNVGSEVDFMHKLPIAYYHDGVNENVICDCPICHNVPGRPVNPDTQQSLDFMFAGYEAYLKEIITLAFNTYRISIYTPGAGLDYWPGGRYMQQAGKIKAAINDKDHFTCASTGTMKSEARLIAEVDQYAAIAGNYVFASGTDTGWAGMDRLEMGPWYYIFMYGGLGQIYWDNLDVSIRSDATVRKKLRENFGPLLATQYFLPYFKTDRTHLQWLSLYEKEKTFDGRTQESS